MIAGETLPRCPGMPIWRTQIKSVLPLINQAPGMFPGIEWRSGGGTKLPSEDDSCCEVSIMTSQFEAYFRVSRASIKAMLAYQFLTICYTRNADCIRQVKWEVSIFEWSDRSGGCRPPKEHNLVIQIFLLSWIMLDFQNHFWVIEGHYWQHFGLLKSFWIIKISLNDHKHLKLSRLLWFNCMIIGC